MRTILSLSERWRAGRFAFRISRLTSAGVALVFAAAVVLGAEEGDKNSKKKSSTKKEKPTTPIHDPADLPFRMAPMAAASRSVAVPLATNLHVAFDMELLRTHTAWAGQGLNLFGPPYHRGKTPFICTHDGPALWTMPPFFPWSVGAVPEKDATNLPAGAAFKAVSTKGGVVTFVYDLAVGGKKVRVHETPRVGGGNTIVRRLEIAPCENDLWFLAHAEMGKPVEVTVARTGAMAALLVQRSNDVLMASARGLDGLTWRGVERDVNYQVEVFTEEGAEKGNPRETVQGHQVRGWLKIPAHAREVAIEIVSALTDKVAEAVKQGLGYWFAEESVRHLGTAIKPPRMAFLTNAEKDPQARPVKVAKADPLARKSVASTEYYRVESFPVPKELDLLVTGLDFLPNGDLAVATWTGEVSIVEHAQGPVMAATYRRFARGLCEPLGLIVKDGQIYLGQKNAITRLIDTDGNGEADWFETVNQGWGYTGGYNSFVYGPVLDQGGNFVIANAGHSGRWDAPYMGWALRISADGSKLEPVCSGLREPNGIGAFGPEREIFVTENQGEWIGACKLNHVEKGKFYGHPSAWPAPKADWANTKTFDPPTIWFPYKIARSSTGLVEITDNRFGPFKGQLIVGDFQNALLTRVALEKVNDAWQGAMWPLTKGFLSGVNRLAYGPDGKLYVGGCQRTWVAVAPMEYSLERVTFTGKVPFEVKEVHALTDGFQLIFTQPVDPATAGKADNYDVSQYTYQYRAKYGSPEIDHDGKEDSATEIKVVAATVSPDKLKVQLKLEGWKAGYVTMVRALDLQSAEGKPLRNDTFWYTLNEIPKQASR